jgi:hypothetical protein
MPRGNTINIKGGRANIKCSACKKTVRYSVSPEVKRKNFRCPRKTCRNYNKSRLYTFNHRKQARRVLTGKVEVILPNETICGHICNSSPNGIGFQGKQLGRRLKRGERINIIMRNISGKKIIRGVVIRNTSPKNVGAEYTDMPKF